MARRASRAARELLELAGDSAVQLDAYIDLGRVLVACLDGRVVGHLQLFHTDVDGVIELKNMAVLEELRYAFTPATGYSAPIVIDGIPLRDASGSRRTFSPTISRGQGQRRARVTFHPMRIARFSTADQTPRYGVIQGEPGSADAVITELAGFPLPPFELGATTHALRDVRLLAPVVGSKIVAVGKNYAEHVREMGGDEPPSDPVLFLKPSTSVVGPDDAIALPALSNEIHHEAELAVVMGGIVRRVPVERALDAVLGYTCANDVTARDLQRSDGQWARAKGFDTFCPLGPWIETELDPGDLAIECRVDGEVRQSGNTRDLLRGVAELISFASAVMTLLPGDVLLTGTPAGVGPIVAGNRVDVTIEGIGTLSNPVVDRD